MIFRPSLSDPLIALAVMRGAAMALALQRAGRNGAVSDSPALLRLLGQADAAMMRRALATLSLNYGRCR